MAPALSLPPAKCPAAPAPNSPGVGRSRRQVTVVRRRPRRWRNPTLRRVGHQTRRAEAHAPTGPFPAAHEPRCPLIEPHQVTTQVDRPSRPPGPRDPGLVVVLRLREGYAAPAARTCTTPTIIFAVH